MDYLQNVMGYFDQQQPLCAQHDKISKDLYQEYGVKAGLRDENGKGVLAGLTNISDIRAFEYVDGSMAAGAAALPLKRRAICCCSVSCPPRKSWKNSAGCWASAVPCPPILPVT